MSIQPVFLWSDVLVFILLAVMGTAAWYVCKHEHLLLPWRRVGKSAVAMVSLQILAVFLLIGIVDSFHYRSALPEKSQGKTVYAPEVLSALDALLTPLRSQTEKTYSAPLAITLYAKESITQANGTVVREYPRLRHAGKGIKDEAERDMDVLQRSALGVLLGGLVAGVLILGCTVVFGTRFKQWRGTTVGKSVLWSTALFAMLSGVIYQLGAAYHVLGTDKVGQDVLYLSLKSIRTGLVIGTITTLVTLPFALFLGIAAGYLRGWVDDVIQYVYTVLSSIPSVLLIAAAVLMVQVSIETHPNWFETEAARADVRLVCLCFILGITSWTGLCRLLRGETMKLREMEYIQAAQSFGVSSTRIITNHIMPNVMHIVLIAVVMDFSGLVLAEAVLSYVGVGVDPSMISFGTMINAARLEMGREPMVWWALAAAFVFMLVLVLAANLFADAVRDAFDPRLRHG